MDMKLFDKFRAIAYEKAGIDIKDGKEALVSARVAKRQRALGIPSTADYLHLLETETSGEELIHFLDAISTNFTSFFREPDHFEILGKLLRKWFDEGKNRVRIWCAASSSGEEPYTLAITALEALEGRKADVRILATDISTKILQMAVAGEYAEDRIRPIDSSKRNRYFTKSGTGANALYTVRPEVKELLVFKRLNLSTPPFPMKGPLDVVFCRNVMIYFDKRVRQNLTTEVQRLLKPGGLFIIGHTETLTGLSSTFKTTKPSVYFKPSV